MGMIAGLVKTFKNIFFECYNVLNICFKSRIDVIYAQIKHYIYVNLNLMNKQTIFLKLWKPC